MKLIWFYNTYPITIKIINVMTLNYFFMKNGNRPGKVNTAQKEKRKKKKRGNMI